MRPVVASGRTPPRGPIKLGMRSGRARTMTTIPLLDVLDWARPQELTVQVVPGADHFFHRRLHCIRNIITGAWLGMPDHRNN